MHVADPVSGRGKSSNSKSPNGKAGLPGKASPRNAANGTTAVIDAELDPRKLLRALQAVREGDFSVRLPSDKIGIAGKVADAFNEIVASNQRLYKELERAGQCGLCTESPGFRCARRLLR